MATVTTRAKKRRAKPAYVPFDFRSVRAADIARIYDVSLQAVGLWHRRDGCPRNEDGTYDLAAVIRWREARAGGERSEEDWETEGQKWRALKHKHELETRQGKYVLASEAAAWWTDRVTEARVALQGVGTALAPSLVGRYVPEIREVIEDRLRAVCDDLARQSKEALSDTDGGTETTEADA